MKVGVIGGGQLAWMMAGAAKKLGISLAIQTPSPHDPAVSVADRIILAPVDDPQGTAQLAEGCEAITFENEFVNLEALSAIALEGVCFRPSLAALAPLLDKYHQRSFLKQLGLPVPDFVAVEVESWETPLAPDPESISLAIAPLSFPIVLKTRRHGYDGQGTFIVKSKVDLDRIWQNIGHQPVILEEFIPFERELAVMAAQSIAGEIAIYPVVETIQEDQVCRRVIVPADVSLAVVRKIEAIARTILDNLQVVGIFGIEFFLTSDGKVLVNEIAPRTHNSGHYSLDACETSQFEQQLRAVTGLPLGEITLKSAGAVMVNLLGYEHSNHDYAQKRQQLAAIPQAYVHWYGKTESRPGRKLGHVTVLLDALGEAKAIGQSRAAKLIAQKIESIWYGTSQ